jgi:hypothetical protein
MEGVQQLARCHVPELECAIFCYRVRRLEDGFPEWKMAGLPVESAVY